MTIHSRVRMMGPTLPVLEGTTMTHSSERTNVLVATGGLALVLLASPLSTVVTVAVALSMIGLALVYRLTANPLRVVRAEVEAEQPSRPRP